MSLFKRTPTTPSSGRRLAPATPQSANKTPTANPTLELAKPAKPITSIGRRTGGNRPVPSGDFPPAFIVIKDKVQQELLNEFNQSPITLDIESGRQTIEPIFSRALASAGLVLSRAERQQLFDMIVADILGFGPLQPLLEDDSITEIMVNGPRRVYIERGGKLVLTDVKFQDNAHVLRIIERILAPLGRRVDEASPMVDARLPDGSRVNAIIPPLAIDGPSITIRKFSKTPLTVEDLIRFGSFTEEFAKFIEACVISHLNIIVSGGTGSGKTTLLNVLSGFIPDTDRIVTIEDSAELQLRQDHVVRLETRPPNIEGKGAITIRDLVINSLRMRPDRLVVGEVRGGEALDMLQAMNTGHDGSLSTAHSNSPRDTLSRLETMVLMAGMELPLRAIRQQIASAIDLIVHVDRLRDGSRRVMYCTEVLNMEGDTILTQDIFRFEEEGVDEEGRIIGQLQPTGIRPKVLERMKEDQVSLPPDLFAPKRMRFR
ncbi:MAG: CpaF family protein [Gammaproteobacteria bacterium]|nr:MAG: CpaF family protein [Gammaproteobacteria bacterium]